MNEEKLKHIEEWEEYCYAKLRENMKLIDPDHKMTFSQLCEVHLIYI